MEFLLPHLLTNSATRHPAREAVRMEGCALTYEQLDQLTNQVARALQTHGVRPGDRVGLYVHKSLASLVCVFGIMKAGAAYVPLDPNAPVQRLAYITRDCDIRVLLTATAKLPRLAEFAAEGSPLRTILLTDSPDPSGATAATTPADGMSLVSWEEVLRQSAGPVDPALIIETDLAYILYTSGSTGAPKGVMISHRTILTFVRWSVDTFQMTPEDRVTSQAPLHFDLSTFDLYATIKAGATIVLIGERLAALPVQLSDLLQNERITITYLVPSILSLMVNYGKLDSHDFSRLRLVLFAGEVFPLRYLRRLAAALPHVALYNLYGPTETNVCTYYQVQPADLDESNTRAIPIGRACENSAVFAVDDHDQILTEPGREGELWVRGSCVAQGYWGDPAKTGRSFIPNPFQKAYPEVVYRTGDIVVLAPDRVNWLYVGRRDHMIKSRGYRIELGEIESALYRHDLVKEAVALAIPDELLGNRIKAVVVITPGSNLTRKDLEAYCAKVLPKYMVPEHFEFIDVLPKTSTGKVDRQALIGRLPSPQTSAPSSPRPA